MDEKEVGVLLLNTAKHNEAKNARQEDEEAAGKAGSCSKAETSLAHLLCCFAFLSLCLFFIPCNVTPAILHIRLCRKARLIQLVGEEEGEEAREKQEGGGDGKPEGGEDVVPVVEGGHCRHKDEDDYQHRHEEAVEAVHLASVHLTLPRQQTFKPLLVPVPVHKG